MALSSLPAGLPAVGMAGRYRLGHMIYLYVLENDKSRHYIGISSNITKRLNEHNLGQVRSTKFYKPWRIIYNEKHPNRIEARRREVTLKTNFYIRSGILNKLK